MDWVLFYFGMLFDGGVAALVRAVLSKSIRKLFGIGGAGGELCILSRLGADGAQCGVVCNRDNDTLSLAKVITSSPPPAIT